MSGFSSKRLYRPIPFEQVSIDDNFWSPRVEVNRLATIPHVYEKLKETGRVDAYKWKPGQPDEPHVFWDSDTAKWIEGACYSLATNPDPTLEAQIDEIIDSMGKIQLPDGYMNVHFILVEPEKRWTNLRDLHELYCAGHLIEAAVAHFHATGKRSFLDIMCRYADHIGRTFGPDKKRGYPGHEELELALIKLYYATGERRYLELSKYFVDERGRQPYYFEQEAAARDEKSCPRSFEYWQAHKPVREQEKVGGHAVRAVYLLSAMADVAADTDDPTLREACDRLWNNLCLTRMYITGGIGTTHANEGFTSDYDLPNDTAYAETCAAIGLVFWNHRMLQFECDGRYADVLERALYNGALSGVSLCGKLFFYVNTLCSKGNHQRVDFFGCSCCPTNVVRFLASVGNYFYSQSEDEIAIHLYAQGSARATVAGQTVEITQEGNYPWDETMAIQIGVEKPLEFGLRLRIPGWCPKAEILINGNPFAIESNTKLGYVAIRREWKNDDVVSLRLSMPVQRFRAHPNLRHNAGLVAIQRGPLLYCLEQVDNEVPLQQILLPETADLTPKSGEGVLHGMTLLTGDALAVDEKDWEDSLYKAGQWKTKPCRITMVPYFAWNNRGQDLMSVWLPKA